MSVLDRNGDRVWPDDIVVDAAGRRYQVLNLWRRGREDLRVKELDGGRRGIELLDASTVTLDRSRR